MVQLMRRKIANYFQIVINQYRVINDLNGKKCIEFLIPMQRFAFNNGFKIIMTTTKRIWLKKCLCNVKNIRHATGESKNFYKLVQQCVARCFDLYSCSRQSTHWNDGNDDSDRVISHSKTDFVVIILRVCVYIYINRSKL